MVRVVHASDWHGQMGFLPEADLYVFTGDMLGNHPVKNRDKEMAKYYRWTIDAEHERLYQGEDIRKMIEDGGGWKQHLGSPDAPVICVRGNHDFVDLAKLFRNCNLVHEFVNNEVIEVCGLKVTGHRGIPYINGLWSDETMRAELLERVRAMTTEGVHMVLTHYAPEGILDKAGNHLGLEGMASVLGRVLKPGGAHCFGHIHEQGGRVEKLGDLQFSNAATTVNVLEIVR